jgi:hypothetical protein
MTQAAIEESTTGLSQWYAFVQGRRLITYVYDEDRVLRRSGKGEFF